LFTIGNIGTKADVPQELTTFGKTWLTVGSSPPPLAVGTLDATFRGEGRVLLDAALPCAGSFILIVGVKPQAPVVPRRLFVCYAKKLPIGAVETTSTRPHSSPT